MKRTSISAAAMIVGLMAPLAAHGAEADLQKKVDGLEKELEAVKKQLKETGQKVDTVESKSIGKWLTISGDYRFRVDSLYGKVPNYFQLNTRNQQANGSDLMVAAGGKHIENETVYTNRFGLNLYAKATENVSVTARLLMYKASGAEDDAAINNYNGVPMFSDRAGLFDGTIGHVPGDNRLAVDRAYATWKNIADQPIWFSVGRRPSTGGIPAHLKQNTERPGNAGVPQLLVDYAFDGMTLGIAPDIDALPGAYAKLCYGRGFQNGITDSPGNGLHNTDMFGVNIAPWDTDALKLELQYNRGFNIFNTPVMLSGPFQGNSPSVDLGDIDWFGLNAIGKVKNVGIGHLNWFLSGALSMTHPNGNTVSVPVQTDVAGFTQGGMLNTGAGLMYTGQNDSTTGWAVFLGGRYDIESTGTKLGFEYNHGSKDWITFAPAADDMWTSKVGTRGDVYETYVIQELKLKPISSYFSKTFFKLGYQYYSFDYTGSNNWVGAPVKISDVKPGDMMLLTPLKHAQDIYLTFEVKF